MATIPYSPISTGTDGGALIFNADANASVAITAISIATAAVVTAAGHGLRTGDTTTIAGTDSTPALDGARVATVIDANHFSVPVTTTVAGTTGTSVKTTYFSDVLDRGLLQGGGAVLIKNTGGSTPTITVNIQGSIDGSNYFNVPYSLVGTPRTFVVTAITITTTATTTYLLQELIPWRYLRLACSANTNETLTAQAWSR